jgi:hypothetical protein
MGLAQSDYPNGIKQVSLWKEFRETKLPRSTSLHLRCHGNSIRRLSKGRNVSNTEKFCFQSKISAKPFFPKLWDNNRRTGTASSGDATIDAKPASRGTGNHGE